MPICKQCRNNAPLGSAFCPRCGGAIDDGLGRGRRRLRVVVAILVGLIGVAVFVSFFTARKVSVPAKVVASPEVRKL